ncbi:MAG: Ribosomal RNA small subunit methyltransferase I [Candidatus Uhrbacteria bacterium GW2011_GWE2_40_58]|nr:MAG: Ribosomal RNA small subunit methyltransferase I [Candidatus Uhrbacteria bacterium GW2011_GWF2_40_263]KKR67821.1 MAG: Ribosomal RNA small subunit methyltransferase I [Candidatus Uhrbacteria bacterium GW2011_GWE2_40_58]HBK34494.1 16S rRNA (cytidine(1402)-2'-O)-methyltransferase [Candidatus Uhrbacteria bacterium]HCB55580.1 16S rRNA (cytidine(1402)-2'-O)-methyltransferase [Candidatus Uhrbacteria bacterium]
MRGILYFVATPIGNLGDLSERAKQIFSSVDLILCEDTRVTHKLLSAFEIKTSTESFHQHSTEKKIESILAELEKGKNIAVVTDAGTPGISDPGGKLVEAALARFGNEVAIYPIPGPCAAIAALSISGFPTDHFHFLGFPPQKKGRIKFFQALANFSETSVFYESTHRIIKALEQMEESIPHRHIVVCRELTKLHETTYRGTPSEVTEQLKSTSMKGEFVIVVGPQK